VSWKTLIIAMVDPIGFSVTFVTHRSLIACHQACHANRTVTHIVLPTVTGRRPDRYIRNHDFQLRTRSRNYDSKKNAHPFDFEERFANCSSVSQSNYSQVHAYPKLHHNQQTYILGCQYIDLDIYYYNI
jgi:hypothetical protein